MTRRRALLVGSAGLVASAGCLDTIRGGESRALDDADADFEEERRTIIGYYEDGIDDWNNGTEARDQGINLFNAEEFDRSIEEIEAAVDYYADAEPTFAEAAAIAREIGYDDSASICENAVENTRLQIEATEAALAATTAARDDEEVSVINEHVEEFQALTEEAEDVPVEDADILASTLGFE